MVARTLTTQRLTLRLPVSSDLPAYMAFACGERSRSVGGPFEVFDAFSKMAAMIGHWELRGWGRYVIDLDGTPIGHCGPLDTLTDTPEMTWTLWDGALMGQGLATEAVQAVISHLLETCGWPALKVCIDPSNEASHRMARRVGAVPSDEPGPARWPEAQTYYLRGEAA